MMAGRKRKMTALTGAATPQPAKVSPAKLNKKCEHPQSAATELSHYFINNDLQHRLEDDFFKQPCIRLAKALLGKVLVRRCADGTELRGRIVETEAYLGGEDKASHSAGGKRTERTTAMFMKPGTIYVYPIYGIYLCMNVSSEGEGAAVLLRSLEPLQDPDVWLEREPDTNTAEPHDIVSAPRIGIESHGEWAKKPWRFYLRGHHCVSVVNKEAEGQSGNVMNNLGPSDVQSDTGQHKVKRA
ncbi:hypothetical protein VZT92_007173 [Zoarces viviparus]|uniref:DNA-3-methyladenine glycosylase II n=1 Tax=Zoarces viviparus TaxID=48416 RepID=A0AAW1FIZ9_ZOAVI